MLPRLPIDEILPDVVSALSRPATRVVVVEAPPGAGKTTRLPPALLGTVSKEVQILVSEPRRIAARLAARRVAEELNEPLGARVGYQVRFEDKTGPSTRLIYQTEGLLLRKLLSEDTPLSNTVLFLDEVHERSANLDTILSLVRHALTQQANFKVVAMSATLNADDLMRYFGEGTLRYVSEGRSYPVSITFAPKVDERPLPIQVRSAVREAMARPGDILVFLPGAAEIRACQEALGSVSDLNVESLHGDQPLHEQARVVSHHEGGRRAVLSTNLAESSLTIPGITTVIDSGTARASIFDPWSDVSRLETVSISQARAIQRAGRAGRLSAGHTIRLYTQGQFNTRPAQDTPELLRSDLSELLLMLLALAHRGGPAFEDLNFLDTPPAASWAQARLLLGALGALRQGQLTDVGLKMSQLSCAPRLGRSLVAAMEKGVLARACVGAALLSERDVVLASRRNHSNAEVEATDSDLDERIERVVQLVDGNFNRRLAQDLDLDLQVARQVEQAARQLYEQASKVLSTRKSAQNSRNFHEQLEREPADASLSQAFLVGYVDRVAMIRGEGRDLVLQTGVQASLGHHSGVTAPLLLALAMDAPGGRSRKPIVRLAARLDPDWLLELPDELIEAKDEYTFDDATKRVELVSRLCFGKLVLDESRRHAPANAQSQDVLVQTLIGRGATLFDPEGHLSTTYARLRVLLLARPDLLSTCSEPEQHRIRSWVDDEARLQRDAVTAAVSGNTQLHQVLEQNLGDALFNAMPPDVARALRVETPLEVKLAGGLTVPVHYEKERPPWIEARLQNFFSMTDTVKICAGRVALQLHLLAPNHRAVQVTSDLAGFWERHYPSLRKELMRRYPKHLWPEDGRTAHPPTPGRIR